MHRTQLAAAELPADLVTASMVPANMASRIDGALLVVPIQEGDPVMWQMLDDADHPTNILACMFSVRDLVARKWASDRRLPKGRVLAKAEHEATGSVGQDILASLAADDSHGTCRGHRS